MTALFPSRLLLGSSSVAQSSTALLQITILAHLSVIQQSALFTTEHFYNLVIKTSLLPQLKQSSAAAFPLAYVKKASGLTLSF